MLARLESTDIREVQVLRDQHTVGRLCGTPDHVVARAHQVLGRNCIHVVPLTADHGDEFDWKILVEFDPHRIDGTGGVGRSSSAEEAAKAIAARTCSSVSVGKL